MTALWTVLVGVGALTAFALFVGAVRRWPVLGVISIAVNVLIAWELPYPPALAVVNEYSIYFLDVLSGSLLIIGMMGLKQLFRNVGAGAWSWLAFGCLILVSLLRGVPEFGFGATLNEFRSFLYPFTAITWAMSLAWNSTLTTALVQRFALALGWGLVVIAGYHIFRYGLGGASEFVDAGTGIEQTGRPLISGQALMLLLCAIVALWLWGRERKTVFLVSGLVFICVVVVVQQRTVWGVGAAVAIVVFLVGGASAKRALIPAGLIIAWMVGIILTSNAAPSLLAQFSDSATNSGTYGARVTSWLNLIDQSMSQGLGTVVFGAPIGSGFGRFEGVGRWVEFSPHNWYLTIYLRAGLLGLALFLVFLAIVLAKTLRVRAGVTVTSTVILTAIVVYGWSYSWPWYTGIFIGWAIASNSSGQEPTAQSPPDEIRGTRRSATGLTATMSTILSQTRRMNPHGDA